MKSLLTLIAKLLWYMDVMFDISIITMHASEAFVRLLTGI